MSYFVRFTSPSGRQVSIKADQVVSIHESLPNGMADGVKTVIVCTNGQFQGVKDALAEVEKKLS